MATRAKEQGADQIARACSVLRSASALAKSGPLRKEIRQQRPAVDGDGLDVQLARQPGERVERDAHLGTQDDGQADTQARLRCRSPPAKHHRQLAQHEHCTLALELDDGRDRAGLVRWR
eukprot:CAMPEP_0183343684 /NCGR_PEP_ID=MMETSP0164_2-20130417/9540_1 /TAXON_ID=221442 /ORGANISM="Coccolithus pelagicus ssp braarudi, Strain PLY182g" /LENGTH=118 /DNA_ID=CAMNT_0025514555 /DNA_START=169 /DNA_END=523 /DNA_ORIENTATION=-